MHLRRVGGDDPEIVRHLEVDLDRLRQRFTKNLDNLFDEMLGLQRYALTFDASRERQHLSHHTCATLGIRSHDFEPLLAVLVSDLQLQHVDRH